MEVQYIRGWEPAGESVVWAASSFSSVWALRSSQHKVLRASWSSSLDVSAFVDDEQMFPDVTVYDIKLWKSATVKNTHFQLKMISASALHQISRELERYLLDTVHVSFLEWFAAVWWRRAGLRCGGGLESPPVSSERPAGKYRLCSQVSTVAKVS